MAKVVAYTVGVIILVFDKIDDLFESIFSGERVRELEERIDDRE